MIPTIESLNSYALWFDTQKKKKKKKLSKEIVGRKY